MTKTFELRVKKQEPTLVPPAKETTKGTYYLSNIDQLSFPNFVSNILCYKSQDKNNKDVVMVIKKSLARVLIHYYPLAGRFVLTKEGKFIVNCTAEGAVFVEAKANCELEDIGDVKNIDHVQLAKLAYNITDTNDILKIPPLIIQVTNFKCGGFIFGFTISHLMIDCFGIMQFLNSLGETARGLPISVFPFLDRDILQPRNPPIVKFTHREFIELEDISSTNILYEQENMLERSFLFERVKLEKIKKMAMEDGVIKKCTTFEALSGFIWKARIIAMSLHPDQHIKIALTVDCRKFFDPPLPRGYFGNVIWDVVSVTTVGELVVNPLSFAVGLVQDAIKMINYEYLKSAIDYIEVRPPGKWMTSTTATTIISSLTRMSYHTKDFGWGAPVQFGPVSLDPKELIFFMPHGMENESISVRVALPSSAIKTFERVVNT